jgi:hypothetical protein
MTVPAINTPLFSYPAAPGGLLYTYVAGGTTPQQTFSDAAGTIPNSNPVVLDTTGSAIVRGSGAYHLLLKDSTGTHTLWDEDQLLYGVATIGYTVDSGTVNTIVITNPSVSAITGTTFKAKLAYTNTSASVTLACNGGSAYPVKMNTLQLPVVGQLIAGRILDLCFDGTQWICVDFNGIILTATGSGSIPAPSSGTALAINGSAYTPTFAIGNSGTAFTLNCDSSNVQTLVMSGNVIASAFTISNPRDGQTVNLRITQGSGPYTLGWPTSFKWSGGTPASISTANGAVDLLVITYTADTGFWLASLGKAFA